MTPAKSGMADLDRPLHILLNGEPRELAAGATVQALVDSLGAAAGRVAVERNRRIVPRAEWGTPLEEGDRIEVVAFVGGG